MTTVARSEATAAPAAAKPERKGAPGGSSRALPDMVLRMQRAAGNAAVARTVAQAAAASIQRCGAGCGCSTCGSHDEELLEEERLGAGLLRSAVARRSG